MPSGKTFVRHASIFSLSSPYIYDGKKSKQEILDIYLEAVEFGISQLGKKEGSKGSLLQELENQEFSDSENLVIIFDFLLQDYVHNNYQMSGTEFKSAMSAYNLQEDPKFIQIVERIGDSLVHH